MMSLLGNMLSAFGSRRKARLDVRFERNMPLRSGPVCCSWRLAISRRPVVMHCLADFVSAAEDTSLDLEAILNHVKLQTGVRRRNVRLEFAPFAYLWPRHLLTDTQQTFHLGTVRIRQEVEPVLSASE